MTNFNTDVFASPAYQNVKTKQPGEGNRKFLMTVDYRKLKEETGIEKFSFEVGGEYCFDFLPFPVGKNHPRYKDLVRTFEGKGDPIDWEIQLPVHNIKTPNGNWKIVCSKKAFNRPCPICEEKSRLFHEGGGKWENNTNQSEIKALPSDTVRGLYLVRNTEDGKVYIMDYNYKMFGEGLRTKLERTESHKKTVILANPGANGHSLRFWVEASSLKDRNGNPVIGEIKQTEFESRDEAVPMDLLQKLPALDKYIVEYSYDDVVAMMDGTYFEESGDEEEDTYSPGPTNDVSGLSTNDDDEPEETTSFKIGTGKTPAFMPQQTTPVQSEPATRELTREERRAQRLAQRQKSATPECPAGGEFGADIDKFDACDDCELFDQCEKAFQEQQ